MNIKLTNSSVERAKPKQTPYELRDTKIVGLIVRVQPTGRKAFYCQYQRGSRVKLGIFPSLSIKDAHTKALKVFSDFHSGKDPRKPKRGSVKPTRFGVFLKEHYFPWVDANHKNPRDTKQRLLAECGAFSSFHFKEITPYAVDKWRLEKIARGNSPHTANKCFAYLRAALAKSDEWEIHSPNPIAKMKKIKTDKSGRVRYLSVHEEIRLRACLKTREDYGRFSNDNLLPFTDHLTPMVLISINTGLRQGELFSLKWKCVDLDLKQISIAAGNAKSRKVRYVPLNNEALSMFCQLYKPSHSQETFVFRRKNNEAFKNVRKSWGNLLNESKIQNFRWHDLRHHFASKLAMAGVDLNTVRELLGHSSYEMTLRYAHLSAGHKADAVALLQGNPLE